MSPRGTHHHVRIPGPVSDHPGPAPRTRLSGRQVANLSLNLRCGQCVLKRLIKATDLQPVPQSCRMGCAGGTGRGRRAGADGTGTQRFGGPLVPGWHPPCAAAGDKGTPGPSGGTGRRGRVGRPGAPQRCQILPLGCLERWIFRLEMAEQEREAKPTIAIHTG